nr:MAG: hypothetical protein H2Bulk35167_000001 [Mitovirus sp.]
MPIHFRVAGISIPELLWVIGIASDLGEWLPSRYTETPIGFPSKASAKQTHFPLTA